MGHTPDVVAAHAYDALHILARAIQAVGADPEKVAEHLPRAGDYHGVVGVTTLDENGEAKRPLTVKTINGGKFVPWKAPGATTPK